MAISATSPARCWPRGRRVARRSSPSSASAGRSPTPVARTRGVRRCGRCSGRSVRSRHAISSSSSAASCASVSRKRKSRRRWRRRSRVRSPRSAAALPAPFAVEDKYDGIRAQAHIGDGRVVLFSRTLDAIDHGYPEVTAALAALPSGLVLDGELIAYDRATPQRALPFSALQRRLGRKRPHVALLAEVPVALVVYDVLAAAGALVVDEPYGARRARLEAIAWPGVAVRLAPATLVEDAE